MNEGNRNCPRCGSDRVLRSHRRNGLERMYHWLGADLRRCHQCLARRAWFGSLHFPLSSRKPSNTWLGVALSGSGGAICLLAAWWIISRLPLPG